MHTLRKILPLFLLALYGLIILHDVVPHDHFSHTDNIVADHHHDGDSHNHKHSHQHSSEKDDALIDLFLALFNVHSHQYDNEETHFEILKPSLTKSISDFDIQLHLYTPFQNDYSPPLTPVSYFELFNEIWVINDYSIFHPLRGPPALS